MATQVPPLRGAIFYLEVSLVSQADTDIFQNNPTMAAGDVVVYQGGALDGNIDTLPTAIGAGRVLAVTVSAAEMTADRVTVLFHDAAGDEWQDLLVNIHTVTTSQIDDLSTAATALSTATWTGARAGYLDNLNIAEDVAGTSEISALNDLSAAQVNAEVVDALATDTYAEPGQEAPTATTSLSDKIGYLYKVFRNKLTQTAATLSIYNDAGAVVDQKATVSDDGTTFTRGEIGTGP